MDNPSIFHRCVRDMNCTFFMEEEFLIRIYIQERYTHNVRRANYMHDIIIVRRLATLHLNDRASNCLARRAALFDPRSSVVNTGVPPSCYAIAVGGADARNRGCANRTIGLFADTPG